MHALILDGGVKSALACVRSLGQRGARVTVGAEQSTGMALWSRYAKETFVYRSPLTDPEGFLEDVLAVAQKAGDQPILFSMSDATMLLISRNRARFDGIAQLVLPSSESLEIAADKEKTRSLAESLKIPTPPPAAPAVFPVVVKPRHSVVWKEGVGVGGTAAFGFSDAQVRDMVLDVTQKTGEEPLQQTFIRGSEFGFEALCHGGEVLAYAGHRRMRSLSPTGGAAVVKTTVLLDAGMQTHAETLLKALRWEGVAMVEFKQDAQLGTPYLLEINPRFWGSLPLAIHAGVDFPFLYVLLAEGKFDHIRALTERGYEHRVTSRHWLGDVRHLGRVLFARDPLRSELYPSRARALFDFVAPASGMRHDVFSLGDPLPFFMEILDHL